jgi:hypothetical protein
VPALFVPALHEPVHFVSGQDQGDHKGAPLRYERCDYEVWFISSRARAGKCACPLAAVVLYRIRHEALGR